MGLDPRGSATLKVAQAPKTRGRKIYLIKGSRPIIRKKPKRWRGFLLRIILYLPLLALLGQSIQSYLFTSQRFAIHEIHLDSPFWSPEVSQEIKTLIGQNYFTLKAETHIRRLEFLPAVKKVTIEKVFPDRLVIKTEIKRPFAIASIHGSLYVIGRDGSILAPYTMKESLPFRPLLKGYEGKNLCPRAEGPSLEIREAVRLWGALTQLPNVLYGLVQEVSVESGGGINLGLLGSHTVIRCQGGDSSHQSARLMRVVKDLLERVPNFCSVKYIDLRFGTLVPVGYHHEKSEARSRS